MEIDGKEYSQWLYDEIKKGEHTPLSNSSVIFYFKECAKNKDMGTAQFYVSAAYLVEELTTADQREEELINKLEAYESPWLPIDYTQAEYCKGCFDGGYWMLESYEGHYITGKWDSNCRMWTTKFGWALSTNQIKGYRPIPAGWIGGV